MTDEKPEETPDVVLGHFATYRVTPRMWELDPDERKRRARAWVAGLEETADNTVLYLIQGIESEGDVLVWSSTRIPDAAVPARYFPVRARAENAHRDVLERKHVLWGLTRPSQYSRSAKSAQAINPFDPERTPYIVMYPFTKTADWYLKSRDSRQGMMNEHIRIGKQFREITQLLLYSFGLQDQEFVVVYETGDLELFSELVYDLRDTEARIYTKGDTPLHTGVLVTPEQWVETLG